MNITSISATTLPGESELILIPINPERFSYNGLRKTLICEDKFLYAKLLLSLISLTKSRSIVITTANIVIPAVGKVVGESVVGVVATETELVTASTLELKTDGDAVSLRLTLELNTEADGVSRALTLRLSFDDDGVS